MRIKNLAGLDRDRHLIRSRPGGVTHLVIAGTETKNRMPIEVELAPHVVELLDFYWDRYRPRLAKDPAARWVFPGVTGGPKVAEVLAKQIGQTIRTETGLTMNVHLFRHLAAKLVLQADEGSYETARLLLGHRSLATTVSAYTGTEHAAAFRRYDRILDHHRCRA